MEFPKAALHGPQEAALPLGPRRMNGRKAGLRFKKRRPASSRPHGKIPSPGPSKSQRDEGGADDGPSDPGCGNGIPPADGRESAGSSRSGCAGGRRRAAGSENLSGSNAGILMKTSETGGKSSESKALAEMPGSGGFKGGVSAAGGGAARSAKMEACAGGGMHWILTAKDNNKKAFRAIRDIFCFSGAAPLFEGGCACSAALKPAEAPPDLPAISGIIAKITLDRSHGSLIARDCFLALDAESLGLGKKFPGFASAGCVRAAKMPSNPCKPPEAGYQCFFSSAGNLDIFTCAVRKRRRVEECRFQVDAAMKNGKTGRRRVADHSSPLK
ncbi:MAG: hypothetical protein LBU32_05395 [Clostridiales bacterium]|jgi:hypothetical protein|nr:hypothetical protein [Clostridiales bacterium]